MKLLVLLAVSVCVALFIVAPMGSAQAPAAKSAASRSPARQRLSDALRESADFLAARSSH
jgi:hypothetical protein